MTRINLLPPEKIKERRRVAGGGRGIWFIFIIPVLVLAGMLFWYFSMGSQMSENEQAITAAKQELDSWKRKNAELKQYQDKLAEIQKVESTAISALQGRVFWARILNEIAIMCPNDIWLTSLNGSSTAGEGGAGGSGSVAFEGYALQCPNRHNMMGSYFPFLPDFRPVANWLERMAQIVEFQKVWLSSAEPIEQGGGTTTQSVVGPDGTVIEQTVEIPGTWLIRFSSTATLNMEKATISGASSTPAAPGASSVPTSSPGSSP